MPWKKNEPVDSERLLATVFMVGVDTGELTGLSSRLIDSTVVLPCCLSNGDTTVTTALFEALEKRFDTQIQPIEFLPRHLQWMLAMWSMLDKNQPAKKPSSRQADENGSARAEECAVPTPPPPPPTDTDDLPDEVDLQPVKNTFSPHVDLVYGLPEVMTDEGCGVRLLELQFPRKVMEGIRKRAFHTDRGGFLQGCFGERGQFQPEGQSGQVRAPSDPGPGLCLQGHRPSPDREAGQGQDRPQLPQ